MSLRTPLAWKNLTHDRRRLVLATAGIAFAVMLMFQQRGFRHALFDSTVEIVRVLDADLILFNPTRFALSNEARFPREAIDVATSNHQIASVIPLYIENLSARLRVEGGRARPIRVLAWDMNKPILLDEECQIIPQLFKLARPGTALMDRLSQKTFGFDLSKTAPDVQVGELANKKIEIVGLFRLGTDFAHEGNLIMSLDNFTNYFGYRNPDPRAIVDLGVVKVSPGENPQEVAQLLEKQLGSQVRVMTKQAFIDREIGFWSRSTPIGIIFTIGAMMGFAVGVIICYQILANDITEHLGEFATLKAMGYRDRYFIGLVVRQSIYLSLFGFLPGLIASWILFWFNSNMTGLLTRLTWDRILSIFVLTILMCVVSGLLALRKLMAADPASLF
ncbi:MAG: ABC transporter permease DevC [Pirellulaceae bacterium]